MKPEAIAAFLDGAIRSRIAVRCIAEQHIALTRALKLAGESGVDVERSGGVVDYECSPLEMINLCGSFVHDLCVGTFGSAPEIKVDGMTDVTFPYVFPYFFISIPCLNFTQLRFGTR
jgi:Mitochondrial branched-chain alpha-ketoacid dehydrogenase kinase